jgi:hypothetical protein
VYIPVRRLEQTTQPRRGFTPIPSSQRLPENGSSQPILDGIGRDRYGQALLRRGRTVSRLPNHSGLVLSVVENRSFDVYRAIARVVYDRAARSAGG